MGWLEHPAIWFLILGILLAIAIGIWAAVNSNFNSTFWIFMILAIVIIVWAIIGIIIQALSGPSKSKNNIEDLLGNPAVSANGMSEF